MFKSNQNNSDWLLSFSSSPLISSPSSAPLCLRPWTSRGRSTTAASPARWARPWATPASAPAPLPALRSAPTRRTLQAPTTTVSSQVTHESDERYRPPLGQKWEWASASHAEIQLDLWPPCGGGSAETQIPPLRGEHNMKTLAIWSAGWTQAKQLNQRLYNCCPTRLSLKWVLYIIELQIIISS